jgi:predicted SnoaL-like aldol condensation-catalyzing enzyme
MQSNKEIVMRFYEEVFNNWDLSNIDALMHDHYRQHNPMVEDGKAGFLKFCEKFLAQKPHMEIHRILCDGDLVCVFFKCTLETTGAQNKVFDLYRVEGGKLAEHWDCVEHNIENVVPVHTNGLF